ncbi:MAG: IclR family transcriptional regulator [Hungatella sp.]|jgi:DNA-binding IclR family transcriptional regulator|nr:IclR family transcriptional regulator [Hungatella sp.]
MSENPKTPGIQSGEKTLSVLEYMILKQEPVRLLDIAKDLRMTNTTATRYLNTLMNKGYVEQNPSTLMYSATFKIVALANHLSNHRDLKQIARPYLEQLTRIFGESTNIAVEQNMSSVYIDVIRETNSSLMAIQYVGNAAPMHCTGNGKLLLLNYSDEELEQFIMKKGLPRFTENTYVTKESLKQELERIRQRGYAYDEEERELGIRCLAFPVFDARGRIIAGMSVTGPKGRMKDEILDKRLEDFRQIALEVSRKLGYQAFEK